MTCGVFLTRSILPHLPRITHYTPSPTSCSQFHFSDAAHLDLSHERPRHSSPSPYNSPFEPDLRRSHPIHPSQHSLTSKWQQLQQIDKSLRRRVPLLHRDLFVPTIRKFSFVETLVVVSSRLPLPITTSTVLNVKFPMLRTFILPMNAHDTLPLLHPSLPLTTICADLITLTDSSL